MSVRNPDRERLGVWLVGLLVVVASLGIGYFGTPLHGTPSDVEAARANPDVTIARYDDGFVITPRTDSNPTADEVTSTALVFYPGGRVHPDAYLPVLAPVAARTGTTIFIPHPPLNLAVLDIDAAEDIIAAHPTVDHWVVGGHSLGGAMAGRFAAGNPERVSGLVLFASYCDRDLTGTDLRVLAVRGGADTVLDATAYRNNRDHLPESRTVEVTIPGMNHSQFGAYRGQPGDRPAPIEYDEAHDALQATLSDFLTAEIDSETG